MDSHNSPTTKPIYLGTQIVWYVFGLLEALLIFRFFLKLFSANSASGFTDFIYSSTNFFVYPFADVFRISQVDGQIFELATVLAIIVYWFIAWGIIKILIMSKSISTPEAAEKLNKENK
jgi:hypothetical protein